MPEELAQQMPVLKDVLDAMNIPRYELAGYEADDLIGTIQRHRRLFTNSLDARNVVAGVAHECLQVDDVDGVEAVYLPE